MKRIVKKLHSYINKFRFWVYSKQMSSNIKEIKNKPKIRVLFVVSELGSWKTENLYNEMGKKSRLEPILGICQSAYDHAQYPLLFNYVNDKGYKYVVLDGISIKKILHPDIIIYQKPYGNAYADNIKYTNNLYSLFCYVNYGFNSINEAWAIHNELGYLCWQFYIENTLVLESRKKLMRNCGKNLVCTGLPMMDALTIPKSYYTDPWHSKNRRKRIIYAPHHTIGDQHAQGINYSTFIEWGECILAFAKKYSKETQWVFKPHPLLRMKLYRIWDKDRVDRYYQAWEELENSQVELGKYEALFKYSDAMIHDCASFQIEYHYTVNPVLYLVRDINHSENLNEFAKMAYDLHYHAHNIEDVELFIRSVIEGVDPLRAKRQSFYDNYLLPPNGKDACENIINAILDGIDNA